MRKIAEATGEALKVLFDEEGGTWNAVGRNGTRFNYIGQQVHGLIPPFNKTWKEVLDERKNLVMKKVEVNIPIELCLVYIIMTFNYLNVFFFNLLQGPFQYDLDNEEKIALTHATFDREVSK